MRSAHTRGQVILAATMLATGMHCISGCTSWPIFGSGLRFVRVQEPTANEHESIARRTYLYDGSQQISSAYDGDISPSGRFAAFSDNRGRMLLYDGERDSLTVIIDGGSAGFPMPVRHDWNEAESSLRIYYWENDEKHRTLQNIKFWPVRL